MNRAPGMPGKYQSQADQRQNLTIGQLSQLTGINTKAIRYYEGAGLLPCPPRSANHYRRYGTASLTGEGT